MPRARVLWPEHLNHPSVGHLSNLEYRLWVGLLQLADDEGRVRGATPWIRSMVLPYDRSTSNQRLDKALIAIAATGLIKLYEADGEKYVYFPSWKKWQHPRYPTKSKLPDPLRYGSPTVDLPQACGARGVGVGVERNRRGSTALGTDHATDVFFSELERLRQEKGMKPSTADPTKPTDP